jgi:hypothetical protein
VDVDEVIGGHSDGIWMEMATGVTMAVEGQRRTEDSVGVTQAGAEV